MRKSFLLMHLILVASVLAHPASEVEMSFDTETSTLTITALHSVKSSIDHYIDEITVELNGKEIIKQTFKKQTENEFQSVSYIIVDAKAGDEIKVNTKCSKIGKKSAKMVIEENKED